MKTFLASIKKEFLVLLRDRSGLGILFIMPLALVVIMALVQDGPYKNFQKSEYPMIFVDNDKDTVGAVVERNIRDAHIFKINTEIDGVPATEKMAREAVSQGKYRAGVVVPAGLSKYLRRNARILVAKTFSGFPEAGSSHVPKPPDSMNVKYFLDPLTTFSFKNTIIYILEKSLSSLISQTLTINYYKHFENFYPVENKINFDSCQIIGMQEISASSTYNADVVFNSVQHNVPAWTMFAMFFIFLPLAGSIIKERDYGTFIRLRFMPGSFSTLIAGKVFLYTIVGCIQFLMMLAAGRSLLPALGLPALIIGHSYAAIAATVLAASLAATGFGVLIGTFFSTHQQMVTFGSISVIILAALGGIFVPIYIMSKTMAKISKYSPLEWGLNAFNEIFLHQGTFINIYLDSLKLLLFASTAFLLSFLYYKYKRIH
ncbi:MAG TPA: ABC transporter permease [Bacteroidales bacterium]|nr:ABC transporter permease [Bacteroidales bacterium]HQI70676.1 ABC transporter permease [Bacteroidales bacterium]